MPRRDPVAVTVGGAVYWELSRRLFLHLRSWDICHIAVGREQRMLTTNAAEAAAPADRRGSGTRFAAKPRPNTVKGWTNGPSPISRRFFGRLYGGGRTLAAGKRLCRSGMVYVDKWTGREEALADCAAALRLDADCTAAWPPVGSGLARLRPPRPGTSSLCRRLEGREPAAAADYADLARVALALDRPDDAACDVTRHALGATRGWPDAYEVRALARLRQGCDRTGGGRRRPGGRSHESRNRAPRLPRTLQCSATWRATTDLALADADRALAMAPRLPAALRQRGSVYRGKNDRDRAVADYRRPSRP